MRARSRAASSKDQSMTLADAVAAAKSSGGAVVFYTVLNKISYRMPDNLAIGAWTSLITGEDLDNAAAFIEYFRADTAAIIFSKLIELDSTLHFVTSAVANEAVRGEFPDLPAEIFGNRPSVAITFMDILRVARENTEGVLNQFPVTVRIMRKIGHPCAEIATKFLAGFNITA